MKPVSPLGLGKINIMKSLSDFLLPSKPTVHVVAGLNTYKVMLLLCLWDA